MVACLNLKNINRKELSKYPCLLASELSIFTQKVNGLKFLSSAFNSLNELVSKVVRKFSDIRL